MPDETQTQPERATVMVRAKMPVSRGVQGVCNRLRDQSDEIATLERRLVAAKKRRVQLILKLRHAGLPLRTIEPLAGITNARISQIEQEAKRAPDSGYPPPVIDDPSA